ncbi:asparagine synthetase B [Mesorhizobium sp. M7D.F.Ca.US.004.03.1.1]|nr:asparagine synthetase B [Mesorhizobium sp. M7D.F.Ca.US.004.01.2.1]RVA32855.1 asparagine synthetase B [Mesorhizobium sp. M7D.F.Ca.US.004.03.1.1]
MCGIAGVWRKRNPIAGGDLADVGRMMQALVHRGPDDHATWNDRRLALGHRRLSIIDLSAAAREPMLTACGQGVLVYNGEVYNYRFLRDALQAEGRVFRTVSDTEVVLEALHHWGPDKAIPLFDGMFSLAYFDARTGALWLARDRLGIKPMSVAETGDRILFASEDKAILTCDGVARDVDAREITLRLAWQSRDSSFSLFQGIERLPPAGLWKISDAGIEKRCFWHVLDVLDAARIANDRATDAEHMATLGSLIRDSVELHCIADTSLAAACSGGVDSGLVTTLAKRFRPEISAYVVDPRVGHSEADDAERTARHAGDPAQGAGRQGPLSRIVAKSRLAPGKRWLACKPCWPAGTCRAMPDRRRQGAAYRRRCRRTVWRLWLAGGQHEIVAALVVARAAVSVEAPACHEVRAPAPGPLPDIDRLSPWLGSQRRAQGAVAGTELSANEDLRPAGTGGIARRPRLPRLLPPGHVFAPAGPAEQA